MMKARKLIKTAALSVTALLATAATQAMGATVEPNIAALYTAQGTSTTSTSYQLTNGVTVTGILNSTASKTTFVVSDGTGSLILYGIATTALATPTVGETISSITSTDAPYQGGQELTSATSLGTIAAGTAPTPPVITVPQFVAAGGYIPAVGTTPASEGPTLGIPPYAEAIVTLDGVTLSGGTAPTATGIPTNTTYTLTDSSGNTTSLYAYASDSAVKAAAADFTSYGTYNITGYVDDYYGTTEIYPLFATETAVTATPLPKSVPAATAGLLLIGGSAVIRRRRTA